MTKKRNKKYNKYKAVNQISKFEWLSSVYYEYYHSMYSKIKHNTCTIEDLIVDLIQMHRLTFLPSEYDCTDVRLELERLFDEYLAGYDIESAETIKHNTIVIKQQELLLSFLDVAKIAMASYTNLLKFAEDNGVMITDHNIYCKLKNSVILNFIDFEAVSDAQMGIRSKLKEAQIATALKNKQKIMVDETGDILI
jgi:hypothetical protein